MLRLFLGLFITLVLGFALAITAVDHVFTWLLNAPTEVYHREAVRGPAYSLVEQLRPLTAEQRQRRLDELQPNYGLGLKLVDAGQLQLDERERQLLANRQLVVRKEFTQFISPIDASSQLLSIDLPPEPELTRTYTVGAYAMLGGLIGIALFLWVWPHWRDLERLRLAAQRFGDNDLRSRIYLSRRSNIRELAEHFNQMAGRIEGLIANQRELTNAVSHELRTPIARLTFELEQLRRLARQEGCGALIDEMHADLGDLEEMVSELLTYASLERGATEIKRETIQANHWIDSVLGSVALEAEAAGVQLSLEACTVQSIRIEPRFMARAVINLLRNAIRYAAGEVRVSLQREGELYRLVVEDDGPGVPLAAREKIFEPFSRLDASRDRRTGGFGLGLALVRRVSQWHGGYAQVGDSREGGACFVLSWPHVDG
ncbi:ATP-binding protein [Pseudomonas donghuensis]|uniref:ATP-binding protein n=1 Tax=Pseudomonas donghuensis TaxID=1163398 RepID=UPI00215E1EEC|nr:ATP-binding protein [Pseudomonas donghuensis]UVL29160.1 HAMP domain-containing protein [Pseudomonas donghuensis]